MRQDNSRTAETYVVCLDCGARILYDWGTMRMARQPVGSEKSIRTRSGHRPRGMANPAPNRWFERLVHHT